MATKTQKTVLAGLLILLFHMSNFVNAFLDIEELKSVQYGIDIVNEPVAWTPEKEADNAVTVTSKYGQNYKCSFPDQMEADKKKEEEEKVAMETGIPELLKPMETGPCLFKNKDWWSYEFCYGKHIRQFHVEDGKIVGDITILGLYESEFNWNNETEAEKIAQNKLNRYHSQSYINGTLCDLTQKPRRTEVRFMCEEGSGDHIGGIDEPETCAYILTVYTSKICHHPYLRAPSKNIPVPITCNPLLSESDYSEYMLEVENEKKRIEEEKERLEKERLEKERQLEEAMKKSKIEASLDEIMEQGGKQKEQQVDEEAEIEDQNDLEKSAEGVNKDVEKLLKSSLNSEMYNYMKDLGVPSKGFKLKVVKSLDELKETMKEVSKETEELLKKETKMTDGDIQGTDESEKKESDDTADNAMTKEKEIDKDEDLEELNDEDLSNADIKDYKELFQKNREKFMAMKKKVQDNMRAQFDDILKEAGDELGLDKEELDFEKQKTFTEMSNTLNKLLQRLEKTEKDISKVDKQIDELNQKAAEQQNKLPDLTEEDKKDLESKIKGPQTSNDDRVKVRVTKLKRRDIDNMEKNMVQNSNTQKLEKEVQDGLEKAGLDLGSSKIHVKIITTKLSDDDSTMHVLSDDETAAFKNMIVSILEGDDEAAQEEQKHTSMESSYNYVWGKDKKQGKS